MEIGKKIKAARENVGLTQVELADKLQISPRALQNYEADKGGISLDTLNKISNALSVKIEYFVQHLSSTCPAPVQHLSSTHNPTTIPTKKLN